MGEISAAADRPPAALAGPGPGRALQRLVLATRPAFFTASALPVGVGAAWATVRTGHLDFGAFALALLATVLAHAAVNVYNDVGDDLIGADPANTDRIYPYTGGSRFIQCGLLSRAGMKRLSLGLLTATVAIGAVLALGHGVAVVALGLAGLALGWLYSMPGIQLSARGLGELAVGAGLGALPALGAAWLLSGRLEPAAVALALPVSAWVTAILLVNEVPDLASDQGAGKRTLVVRFGVERSRLIYLGLQAIALAGNLGAVALGALPAGFVFVALALAALGSYAASGIVPAGVNRARLKRSIEQTLAIHAIGCLAQIAALLVPYGLR